MHRLKPSAEPQRRAGPGSSPLNLAVIAAQPPASAALSTASVCSWLQRSAPLLYAFQKTPSTQKDPAVCKSKGRAQSWRQCLGLEGLECTGGDLFHDGTNTAAKQQVRNCQRRAVTTNAHRAGA